ncbi:glycosyltransferase family 32 protein [Bombella saccharophila]|uniref:Glycosyltransferase sugar-binding region containing DXD motif-containing protein n=1 Tax=Bombella saccharophila TaxID=2967338 RepID=A0ABT3W9T8_9PROT|nr:glycosyltransferase [Bombella saccharophila]MCX5614383.1 hypothetical protein [Bombella saccharophila]
MFLSRLNTYIACTPQGLSQQHVCAYSDENALPPASEGDMTHHGYVLKNMGNNQYVFTHPEQGNLILHPDMSMTHHSDPLHADSYVRIIDPTILPPPPPVIEPATTIAKYIHQTGKEAEFPESFRHNRDNLILLNPDYDFCYWSDQGGRAIHDFIAEHYGDDVLRYYNAINPRYGAARADLFRYLCLYQLGGVYLDLKSTIVVPLHTIIRPDDTALLSFWPRVGTEYPEIQHVKYAGEYQQFFLIYAAGHPLLRRIIHQTLCNIKLYDPFIHSVGLQGTFLTTGPIIYSRILHSYRTPQNARLFHALTSGVEYNIFSHEAHYAKIGPTHYTRQDTPLIIEPETLP